MTGTAHERTGGIDAAVRAGAAGLARAGVPAARVDAEVLAAHVLGCSRGEMLMGLATGADFPGETLARFDDLVAQRAERVPLQHLTGTAGFRGLTLAVGPGVFVPRPETEVAAGVAVAAVVRAGAAGRRVLAVDLCSGSGAIALAVATEGAAAGVDVTVVAVELSEFAAAWGQRNIDLLGAGRVELRTGGVTGTCDDLTGRVDVVSANPPYIPDDAMPRDPEVRDHDPAVALYGGPDGLAVTREVAVVAASLLRPGGTVVVEHGETQGPAVRGLLEAAGFAGALTLDDLTGRPRATVAVRD